MTSWKRTFGIHICCSVLVLAFLVAVPVLATTTAGQAEAEAVAGSSLQKDPMGRLPSSPEEAQQRLAEKELAWPSADAAVEATAVVAGVQSGVRVTIPYDSVEGFITHGGAGANVRVELVGSGQKVVTADDQGWFKADMSTVGDIVSGDVVRVTDLSGGPTISVDCTLTANIDFDDEPRHRHGGGQHSHRRLHRRTVHLLRRYTPGRRLQPYHILGGRGLYRQLH